MPADFPVPRSEIPRVEVGPEEYLARKLQMEGMVERMVQEYEEYSEVNKRHINLRRWKQVGSRERCKLYRERPKYQTAVGSLGNYNTTASRKQSYGAFSQTSSSSWHDDAASEDSYAGPSSVRSASDSIGSGSYGRGAGRSRRGTSSVRDGPDPQKETQVIADSMPKMLMIGERPGRMEDALHSLVAHNHEELAFAVVFLHQDVADCAILNSMEMPTEEEPYRYMGYKWFVKPSPASAISMIVKNRDSIYIEYTGVTSTQSGEVLGYHIMHSVDIEGFPDFHDRNCVRTSQSMCSIYYQKEENMVEFFMMGNVDIGGTVGQTPFRGMFIADTMFGMPRSIDAGEAKRLTELVNERRRQRAASGRNKLAPLCRLCRSERKGFNRVTLVLCEICGHTVCTRCRVHKKVFESDGILGKFNKFDCCKTCVVDISNMHLPPAKPMRNQIRVPVARAVNQSRGRNWTATSATLYEDEIDDQDAPTPQRLQQYREHSKLSVASTAATEMSSQRSALPPDTSFDGTASMISDVSEFDRSFAILANETAQIDLNRETTGRDTTISYDEYDDDWQPDFAKSQIGGFSRSQINQDLAKSQSLYPNQNNMVAVYKKNGAYDQHSPSGDHQYAVVPADRSRRMQRHETQIALPQQRVPVAVHNSSHKAGPPNLQRTHSGGSDYSRDDLINRMQHLAQLAEATYNTTRHNENLLNDMQNQKKQPLESRNRFFYY